VANNDNDKDFANIHKIFSYYHFSRVESGILYEVIFVSAIAELFGCLKNLNY
jgi:hypothetical protein